MSNEPGNIKWAYSYDEEEYHGSCDTKDHAILEGFLNDPECDTLWVGWYQEWDKQQVIREVGCWDGKRVMEDIVERFIEEAPEWVCEKWGSKLLTPEVCEKVNDFLANLILEIEPPTWFEMSGGSEIVRREEWSKEVDEDNS